MINKKYYIDKFDDDDVIEKKFFLIEKKIFEYNKQYYKNNTSEISDFEYDSLYTYFIKKIKYFPEIKKKLNIFNSIGFEVDQNKYPIYIHKKKMLSLNNVFSNKDFLKFHRYCIEKLKKKEIEYYCDIKLDGVAINILYINGNLIHASTRGDGIYGENITNNIHHIQNIPKKITKINNCPDILEVRGELVINKKDFKKLNHNLFINKEKTYATCRNAVSATIRNTTKNINSRPIKMLAYGIGYIKYDNNHHIFIQYHKYEQIISLLYNLGFDTIQNKIITNNIEKLFQFYNNVKNTRENINYDIDGIVCKVNNISYQNILGNTIKYPKWAIACKFSSTEAISFIDDVIFHVGRTGILTPVATLHPVNIGGIIISRVNLYNMKYILEHNILIGDKVLIVRSGEVIPKIVKKICSTKLSKFVKFPIICPSCNKSLKITNNQLLICEQDWDCVYQSVFKIKYFFSKQAFNVQGFGDKIIYKMIKNKIIKYPYDLFYLHINNIKAQKIIGKKIFSNIINNIHKQKNIELYKFIYALGINGIGENISRTLSTHYLYLKNIIILEEQELKLINGFGDIIYQHWKSFWSNDINMHIVNNLILSNITIYNSLYKVKKNTKKIVLTGYFKEFSRKKIISILNHYNVEVQKNINKNTNYLCMGFKINYNSKLIKAKKLKIEIVNLSTLFNILNIKI